MSLNFRPVKTEWGPHSSNFVESGVVANVLYDLAGYWLGEDEVTQQEVEEVTEVTIQSGGEFLKHLMQRTANDLLDDLEAVAFDHGDVCTVDMMDLLGNMVALAPEWRKYVESDDQLRFWVD
jgi:hypothetical protein